MKISESAAVSFAAAIRWDFFSLITCTRNLNILFNIVSACSMVVPVV